MKKNGFTLVELMVVVIVIGILAAVAMPKFQIAADKTKVAEVQQILTSIAGAEEQYKHANGKYLPLPASYPYDVAVNNAATVAEWNKVGLKVPESKYFKYEVPLATSAVIDETDPLKDYNDSNKPKFTAVATLMRKLTRAESGNTVTIDQNGDKKANRELNELIRSFGALGQ